MIEAKQISLHQRKHSILKEVNLSLKSGELLVIIGPNGAGKSSLMSVLAKEKHAHGSQIYFKNKSLEQWSVHEMATHKAKFSQEHNKDIGLTVEEIVLMGRYPYFKTTPTPQDYAIIQKHMLQTGLLDLKDRPYNQLSGGEKQRVHLARVLAQLENDIPEKLAFFDEPLNNLDIKHQYRILETIKHFTLKGNSAVLVLHDLNMAAEFADKILLLKKGSVVAQGTPLEIFKEEIIHKAYNFPCAVCPNPITNCPMVIFHKA